MYRLLTAFFAATLGSACSSTSTSAVVESPDGHHRHHGHHGSGMHHGFANANEWTQVFDDPERDKWQHPDDVLRALELSPSMTVADVGAGTGYFAVRLARAVPAGEVIATDIE